jgi:hypothetical protein
MRQTTQLYSRLQPLIFKLLPVSLFLLQLWFTFRGYLRFGKYENPFYLFAVSVLIPVIFLVACVGRKTIERVKIDWKVWLSLLIAILFCVYLTYVYHDGFLKFSEPEKSSDVLPQLEALWDRFVKGEQPYYPLPLQGYSPFPVYMPAHWVPMGLSKIFDKDIRWPGMFMLFAMILIYVYYNNKRDGSIVNQMVAAPILPLILYVFYWWGEGDLFITFETPVAAYYLLLALGLVARKLPLVMAGIILCILSRYTLVFWLPLFALMLLYERPFKTSVIAWSAVVLSIVLFYVVPFILRQPSILSDGVRYHNYAAVGEWSWETSWSFELGTYFAPHFKDMFTGSVEERVFKTRIVQGTLMILLNIVGFLFYRKFRGRINFYDFGLASLSFILTFFYAFGPLTYRYYLITPLFLSAVLVTRTLRLWNREME